MSVYHSGKLSKAFVGTATANVELDLISFSVSPTVGVMEFHTSKTGLYSVKESGFLDCSFSITVEQNHAASPYGSTGGNLSLIAGGTVAAQLFLNGSSTNNANWNFPSAILTGNPQSVAVDGKIQTTFNFTANGPWTEPTTSP